MLRAVIATLVLASLSAAAISRGADHEAERLNALTAIAIAGSPEVVSIAGGTHGGERLLAGAAENVGGTWAAAATAHQQVIALEAGRQILRTAALDSGLAQAPRSGMPAAAQDATHAPLADGDEGPARALPADWASDLAALGGDTKTLVRGLQTHLAALGCYRARVDGDWGPASRAAFRRAFGAVATPNRSGEITTDLVLLLGTERASACANIPGANPQIGGTIVAANGAAGDAQPAARSTRRTRVVRLSARRTSNVQIVRVTRATRYGLGAGNLRPAARTRVAQTSSAPRSASNWMARAFRAAN
ncbi:MAG: hypothetical protein GC150_05240 [Rhizobiales bacterium]|nr:hypothetical protein [Hyphomicrobiales bacterium]